VTDATYLGQMAKGAANRLAPRVWVFIWLGFALLIGGSVFHGNTVSLAFTTSSTTLFGLALAVMMLNRKYLSSTTYFHESLVSLIQNDSIPTFCMTDDGAVTYANKSAIQKFGDVTGRSMVLVLADFISNPLNTIFNLQGQARRGENAFEDIVTAAGHMRLSSHFLGPAGFVWRLENLAEQASCAPEMAESVAIPMLIVARDNRILHFNDPMFRLVGGPISNLDRLFLENADPTNGIHEIMTTEGRVSVRLTKFSRENGERELYLAPCHPEETGTLSTENLFDEMPVALMKISESGGVTSSNRMARRLLGFRAEEQIGLPELVQGLGRPVSDWIRAATQGRVLNRSEVVQSCRKGKDSYLQISLSRIIEDGTISLLAVLNDATEMKSLEAQFVQSQKMQAIGQLAGGVAHDFNNLLTAISGYCDLLLLRHDESDPDYGDLIQIHQNSNRAASLVSQLLAFSRKQNLQTETVDLRDVLSDLTHLLNRLLGETVKLSIQNGDTLSMVRADKRQIEQVLMNLVVNARDAMKGGGRVTIKTENLFLSNELRRDRAVVEPGNYVVIRVRDDGEGISPDHAEKIFEPFFTTKKTGEGTGLGLSMVYGIVKQTGGFIFVDSTPENGTEFQILFPALEAPLQIAKAAAKPTARRPLTCEGGVVLLVEDEAPVRAFAARALKMRGHTVLEASCAEDALALLEDKTLLVDVFVTDVIMPGLDGPTWVRQALLERPDVRVVFVSGYAEESFSEHQASITNSVFLPKPFSLKELTQHVQEQLKEITTLHDSEVARDTEQLG